MTKKDFDSTLTRRVEKVLPGAEQLQDVMDDKKLRIYIGADPTGGRLHLGHSIGLRKLMEFAEKGHEAILLFGTGTVLVGDPSFRDSARKLITQEEIDENIKTWKDQVSSIVDFDKVTVKQNGDWLTDMTLKDLVYVASHVSAVQLFKRESFTRRLEQGDTVWYHETMYPLLQGYDSVVMDIDVEIGGTDQEFNMLMGRELQKKMNDREKYVLTTPLIMGTDGRKMSKSYDNCIWLDDSAKDMYGKVMTLNDELIPNYFYMLTDVPEEEVDDIKGRLQSGENPRDLKARLAREIVDIYHDEEKAEAAEEAFNRQFQEGKLPKNIETIELTDESWELAQLLVDARLASSKSEARRLIEQGGVRINQEKVLDSEVTIADGDVLQVGKRRFKRIALN